MLCRDTRYIVFILLLIINNALCDKLRDIANELNTYYNLPIQGEHCIDYEYRNMAVRLLNIKPLISYDARMILSENNAEILYHNFNVTFIFDMKIEVSPNKHILSHYVNHTADDNALSFITITKPHLIAMIKYSSFVLHELPNNAFTYVSPLFPKVIDDLHDLDPFEVFYEMSEQGYKHLYFKLCRIWEERLMSILEVYPPSKSDVMFLSFIKEVPRNKIIDIDCCTLRKVSKASIRSEIKYTNFTSVDLYRRFYNVSFTLAFWTNRMQTETTVVIPDILVTYDSFTIGQVGDSAFITEIVIALFSQFVKVNREC